MNHEFEFEENTLSKDDVSTKCCFLIVIFGGVWKNVAVIRYLQNFPSIINENQYFQSVFEGLSMPVLELEQVPRNYL